MNQIISDTAVRICISVLHRRSLCMAALFSMMWNNLQSTVTRPLHVQVKMGFVDTLAALLATSTLNQIAQQQPSSNRIKTSPVDSTMYKAMINKLCYTVAQTIFGQKRISFPHKLTLLLDVDWISIGKERSENHVLAVSLTDKMAKLSQLKKSSLRSHINLNDAICACNVLTTTARILASTSARTQSNQETFKDNGCTTWSSDIKASMELITTTVIESCFAYSVMNFFAANSIDMEIATVCLAFLQSLYSLIYMVRENIKIPHSVLLLRICINAMDSLAAINADKTGGEISSPITQAAFASIKLSYIIVANVVSKAKVDETFKSYRNIFQTLCQSVKKIKDALNIEEGTEDLQHIAYICKLILNTINLASHAGNLS